jgi:adenylylsulfate kinase-like enzyme
MVIWIIGMSGAGKTTLATALVHSLKSDGHQVIRLDGDTLREVWYTTPGHDIEGRRQNAHQISHLSRMLDRQDIHVVASVLSIFPEWQAWNRAELSSYFEVFLDVPLDVLRRRETKGLYKGAAAGEIKNVVGFDIPFPRPANPDLTIDNSTDLNDMESLVKIVRRSLPAPFKVVS